MKGFYEQLSNGDLRSLEGVFSVTQEILNKPIRVSELVELLFTESDVVRMRAGDALEKIAAIRPDIVTPFAERLLSEAASIKQASVQWHLAQIFTEIRLTGEQTRRAIAILEANLHETGDWIVQNLTLEALAYFTFRGSLSPDYFQNLAQPHLNNPHKSVARRAEKLIAKLSAA